VGGLHGCLRRLRRGLCRCLRSRLGLSLVVVLLLLLELVNQRSLLLLSQHAFRDASKGGSCLFVLQLLAC
jgi:hypothetical protein